LLGVVGALVGLLAWPGEVQALDERVEDVSVAVEVAGVFGVEVSQPHLTFAEVSPGATKVLGEGHFFNQVTCRSNSGRPWYLKAHVLSLRHAQGTVELPVSHLKWNVVESTGASEPAGGRSAFHPFAEQPTLVYASHGDDQRGREAVLKFQYSLSTPPAALAGTYVGQIVFTMAENP